MRDYQLDGLAIYNGFLAGYLGIAKHREYLNRINVFPVPDGDTGNNMVRTFKSIATGLKASRSASRVLSNIADLSLQGARGNSGTILSQFLNGLAASVAEKTVLNVREFGKLARDSAAYAYSAMENPTEGTILTVIRAWADTIYTESMHSISMNELLSRGLTAARKALARTPDQLEILRKNNVVDAGAWGFVSFMEGVSTLNENGPVPLSFRKNLEAIEEESVLAIDHQQHRHVSEELKYRYCTELFIENLSGDTNSIKESLRTLGDSLIVAMGRKKARIHIHTNNPARVVMKCRRFGRIAQQKVDDMFRQAQSVNSRKGRIAVLTDSIADIPRDILDENQIHVLNLNLVWGDEEFLDRLTITPEEFYRQQVIRKDFPGSSAPDTDRVESLYRYLLEYYEGVIVLPVAKSLSGTWQLMTNTAEKFNREVPRIHVIDTCLNSAAQGILVTEVARKASEGAVLKDLIDYAESLKSRIQIFVSVNTFKFMVRGGRVSPMKGLAATLLNLKPIVTLDEDGKGIALEKAFSRKGLWRKIEKILFETERKDGIEKYVVVHAAAKDSARRFSQLATAITGKKPAYVTEISPIVGMHSGKGAVAIGLIRSES